MSPWRTLAALSLLAGCLKAPLPLPEDDAGALDADEAGDAADDVADAAGDVRDAGDAGDRGGGLNDVPVVLTCASPQRLCSGQCREVERDATNCGACNRVCNLNGAISNCERGVCTVAVCRSGYGNCDGVPSNGCEVDLTTDAHCGNCTTRCASPARCSSNAGVFVCLM